MADLYQIEIEHDALNQLIGIGFVNNTKNHLSISENYRELLNQRLFNGDSNPVDPLTDEHRFKALTSEFWHMYPAYRKGMNPSLTFHVWQSEKFSMHHVELAIGWLDEAQQVNPAWKADAVQGYALGINRFIRDRHWLTPIPLINPGNAVNPASVDINSLGWMKKKGFMGSNK